MSSAATLVILLSVVAAEVKVGDKVVTLTTAPVMNGPEKVAEVDLGVELAVKEVNGPWVLVSLPREGKDIQGWILRRSVLVEPRRAFSTLILHYGMVVERAEKEFTRMDSNGDGVLAVDEWRVASRRESLDDLNKRLLEVLGPGLGSGAAAGVKTLKLVNVIITYEGWQDGAFHGLTEPKQLASDFARTKDIRRSRLAQELLDREDPKVRARRAEALFRWADRDNDGNLCLEEFKRALAQEK